MKKNEVKNIILVILYWFMLKWKENYHISNFILIHVEMILSK